MALMTRQQIITMAMNLNDETEDKPSYQTAYFIYDQLVDRVTDSLAGLDCLYLTYTADIVNGQSTYALPAIYRALSMTAIWSNGVGQPLAQLTPQDMDIQYPAWSTNPAQGWPTTAIFNGQTSVTLYPQPNYQIGSGASLTINISGGSATSIVVNTPGTGYLPGLTITFSDSTGSGLTAVATVVNGGISRVDIQTAGTNLTAPTYVIHTGGLKVSGFAVPSTAGVGGVSLWPNPTDLCPLPQMNASACIAFGVAARRCAQHPSPENNSRKADWTAEYKEMRAKIFKEVTESNAGRRAGDAPETITSSFTGSY